MTYLFNSFVEILPLPILIGTLIWIVSLCLFSLFLILLFLLLNQSSSKRFKSKKDFSHEETEMKSVFSCDSLSLISDEKTLKDCPNEKKCFHLENDHPPKKETISPLPLIKLRSLIKNENREKNCSTHRSIIKDLNSFSNSFKQKNLHQSIDSLFSKDSLVQ